MRQLLSETLNLLYNLTHVYPPSKIFDASTYEVWINQLLATPVLGPTLILLYWLRQPILIFFLLPFLIIIVLYTTVICAHLYRLRWWLVIQWTRWWPFAWLSTRTSPAHSTATTASQINSLAQLIKRFYAAFWDAHGRIFNAYEILGLEKIPLGGRALVVYFHGTCPFDAYYFTSRYCIERNKFPIAIVDRFLFRLPAFRSILELIGAIEGSVPQCVELLSAPPNGEPGNVILIAPGGVREALFSDNNYSTVWGKRSGFARIAIEANVPIYPMFTENIRECICVMQFGYKFRRWLYETFRIPLALYYGYFPVKLRTYIGDPIYPMMDESPNHLAERVRQSVEQMIAKHQIRPGSLLNALLQRIPSFDYWLSRKKGHHRD